MQVLIRFDVSDPDAFGSVWQETGERRGQAGLTQLQMWREEGASATWVLFDAGGRESVEEWLSSETALRDQIGGSKAHYLRTV
ncbi:hypothetical protein LX81_00859 [Palleronia aestuarii]|uniref:Uncharacterized protein n=1 Tax=Palleronia aestuarii TaxID=568105 RepID=A0A2W7NE79_9RHOB|nr:hypothetical protein [Palleronia aestuarii]PZX18230.1 hypothetical protein LX81_00859 [Palleronia aestuarii]